MSASLILAIFSRKQEDAQALFVVLPLQFFIYEFTGKQERVVVKVESDSKTCAELKIQTEVINKCLTHSSQNSHSLFLL